MPEFIVELWARNSETFIQIGYKIVLALLIILVSRLLIKALGRGLDRFNRRVESFDETLLPVLKTALSLTVHLIELLIILDIFGVNTGSLIALLGAAGLTIGLALKDTLGHVAAGVMLLILRPFRVGHYVECGSFSGTVEAVSLFTTRLQTPDGLFISAPNSEFWGQPLKNYTRNGRRRLDLIVSISYSDSVDTGLAVLRQIISEEPRFLEDPAPQVMVHAMAESAVNLQLRGWLSVDDYWDAYWDLNRALKREVEAAGLTIPFPQADVHLTQGAP